MSYTDVGQTQRVTAGSTSSTNALLLGVVSATNASGTTDYTRDNTGMLVAERQPSGAYYPLYDGLGSVVALTDASGNVVDTYAYDPWGNVIAQTGTVANPYQFGGAYGAYTDGTGLLKIGARYYDPTLGRWIQPDPVAGGLANPATLNRYPYVTCNPINATDPTGRVSENCIAGAFWLAASGAVLFIPVAGEFADLAFWAGLGVFAGSGSVYLRSGCVPPDEVYGGSSGGSGSLPNR